MDKFWNKWNTRFSKRRSFSVNINGLSDDSHIANAFSKNLSNIYFDSYNDKAEASKYFVGLQWNLLSEFSFNIDTRNVFMSAMWRRV